MTKFASVIIFLMFAGISHAGNIDLLWNGSNVHGVKSYTLGIDFSDDITDILDISGSCRKGKAGGVVSKDEGEIGLNYNPQINARWSIWLNERAGYNKMLGIDYENDLGIGLKYYVYKQGETKFSLSSGILYKFTSAQEDHGRYSHRAKFKSDIFSLIYFYQPNMGDSSDYITKFIGDIGLLKIKDYASILFH